MGSRLGAGGAMAPPGDRRRAATRVGEQYTPRPAAGRRSSEARDLGAETPGQGGGRSAQHHPAGALGQRPEGAPHRLFRGVRAGAGPGALLPPVEEAEEVDPLPRRPQRLHQVQGHRSCRRRHPHQVGPPGLDAAQRGHQLLGRVRAGGGEVEVVAHVGGDQLLAERRLAPLWREVLPVRCSSASAATGRTPAPWLPWPPSWREVRGLAGLTLARQLRRELPELAILTLESHTGNYPEGPLKVGESLTELSTFYLCQVLDLEEYLHARHLRKMGLRFFFPPRGDGFASRPELGSSLYDPVDSFQVARGRLENDLRRLNADAGIEVREGRKVMGIDLGEGGAPHLVRFVRRGGAETETVRARWVIDAMGRRRFLQKQLGLAEPYNETCSAAWFRIPGRLRLADLVEDREWHQRVPGDGRYFSTNHLMGDGYWVWLIPLPHGATSVGIVTREDCVPFSDYSSPAKALDFLAVREPDFHRLLDGSKLLDFKRLRHSSYSSTQVFSTARWSCIGDAGVFSDPLFSPGIDQIGFGNCITVEMLRRDLEGRLDPQDVEHFNQVYLSYNHGATWIAQPAYRYFGRPMAMGGKLLWDIIRGWAINGPQRFEQIYLDRELSEEVLDGAAPLTALATRMARLFADWAELAGHGEGYRFLDYSQVPGVGDLYRRSLRSGRGRDALLEDLGRNARYLEDLALSLFLVAVEDTMPGELGRLGTQPTLNAWAVSLDPERWDEDGLFDPPGEPRPLDPLWTPLRGMFGLGG